jgi:hypothetical protein
MTHILLTGAGFSYNWGGPLAAEVFNALLSDKDIDDCGDLPNYQGVKGALQLKIPTPRGGN